MSQYTYNITTYIIVQAVDVPALTEEIRASGIVTALDTISANDEDVIINFKASLSVDDKNELDAIVLNHPAIPLPTAPKPVHLSSRQAEDEDVPVVYATARPEGCYTIFLGAGDNSKIGKGTKCLFKLTASDASKYLDFTFSEDVWIKDGYMICENAPFGACLDIDIHHPGLGMANVGAFGRNIPLMGTGWFPMDTEDRGLLPAGLVLRVTVHNSNGTGDEDPAADFKVAGRFEVFRRSWTGINQ